MKYLILNFLMVAALTATPRPSLTYFYLHQATLYVVFLIFFLVFVTRPNKPLRAVAVLLALSLFLRLAGVLKLHSPRAKSTA